MYEIMLRAIRAGGYVMSEMRRRIDIMYAGGRLTEDQHVELIQLAREHVNPADHVDVLEKLKELEQRIRSLEQNAGEEMPEDSAADYTPGKWYYSGDIIRFEEKEYVCIAPEGVVCVWSPTEYPAYWSLKTTDASEEN